MGAAWVEENINAIRNTIPNMYLLIPPNMDLYFPLVLGEGGVLVGGVVVDESA